MEEVWMQEGSVEYMSPQRKETTDAALWANTTFSHGDDPTQARDDETPLCAIEPSLICEEGSIRPDEACSVTPREYVPIPKLKVPGRPRGRPRLSPEEKAHREAARLEARRTGRPRGRPRLPSEERKRRKRERRKRERQEAKQAIRRTNPPRMASSSNLS